MSCPSSAGSQFPNHSLATFWKNRVAVHGHTGWADPVVYMYDQLERLMLVRSIISQTQIPRGTALDFGCGTGDFSKLLIAMGFCVCGYDPFVEPDIRSSRFSYAAAYEDISLGPHEADLVLTVTALTHILSETDVLAALAIIRTRMHRNGVLIMVEYALDSAADAETFGLKSNYQVFRTLAEWETLLTRNSLRISDVLPVPQPSISPSKGYILYNQTRIARLRRHYPQLPLARWWLNPLLKWQAARFVEPWPTIADTDGRSPLKLFRCALSDKQP